MLQAKHADRTESYIYDPNVWWSPLARITQRPSDNEGDIRWFNTDLNGAPLEMTDADGAVRWSGDYGSFGALNGQTQDSERFRNGKPVESQPLRYAGQYADDETGLHYNLFRYYDPTVGRFTTQDPIGLAGGENLYAYAPNPISWIDPLGLTSCFRTMKKDATGNYVNSPLDGAPNGTQKGARTEGSNPKHHDFPGVNNSDAMVGPSYTGKQGLSGSQVPLPVDPKRGTVNAVTDLDKLPDGLGAINDHGSHISIYPTKDMTFGEYQKLLNKIEWN